MVGWRPCGAGNIEVGMLPKRTESHYSTVTGAWLLVLLSVFPACSSKQPPAAGSTRRGDGVPVSATVVVQRDVPLEVQVIGNVEAYSTIMVKARVAGQLT